MQAFQSWKENCGKSRQNNPSCWCDIQSGRQTVKPQCAKSPQFLASDRSETSYSVHPSTSFAIVYPGFVTTTLLFCLSEMGEIACFVFCAEHAVSSVCCVRSVCSVCSVRSRITDHLQFRVGQETPGSLTDFMSHHPIIKLT